jgi:hypothetical protein
VRGCIVAGWERKMCDGRGGDWLRERKTQRLPGGWLVLQEKRERVKFFAGFFFSVLPLQMCKITSLYLFFFLFYL